MTDKPSPTTALTTSDGLSPRLRSLLYAGLRDEDSAVEEIARTPLLLDQAQGITEHLYAQARTPAGESGVRRVLFAYFEVYPQPTRSQEAWSLWWAPYVETLQDLPVVALEAGMKAWTAGADAEFLPKPGRLRELAMTVRNPANAAYLIAYKAGRRAHDLALLAASPQLTRHDIAALPEIKARAMPTEAQRESVRGMSAQFAAQVQANKPERPVLPPTPVAFAPGLHVTEAMVAHIQRQDPDFGARDEGGSSVWPVDEDEIDPGMFS
jgi:hypothetical protein